MILFHCLNTLQTTFLIQVQQRAKSESNFNNDSRQNISVNIYGNMPYH